MGRWLSRLLGMRGCLRHRFVFAEKDGFVLEEAKEDVSSRPAWSSSFLR